MKTLFTFLVLLFTCINSSSQWQLDERLTNDPGVSSTLVNNGSRIAANGSIVHVVWEDNRDGNYEIYYKRSTDGGSIWEDDTRLTNNSASSDYPAISLSGQVIHVVWENSVAASNTEIYYKRSTDGGASWGSEVHLTNNPERSHGPSVIVSDQVVHVIWYDNRDLNYQIYYKRSTDGGISWGADTRLTNTTSTSVSPNISLSGQTVHVVWEDDRNVNYEIFHKRSTDGGISWGTDTRLTINTTGLMYPSVNVSGTAVHVVWNDNRDGNYEIYYKRSTDGGVSWGTDTRLTNNSSVSEWPSVTVSGLSVQIVHILWDDNRDGNYEIYYKRSTNGGVSWGADTRLTNNSAFSQYPSVLAFGSAVHIVWSDNRDGNYEIYYKFDPTGNPVGIQNINSEIPERFSLSQNYPNPFNPVTKITFALPKNTFAIITVYDLLGHEIETIVSDQLNAGTYEAEWNAVNFPSGVYYYKLTTGDFSETKKMVLTK